MFEYCLIKLNFMIMNSQHRRLNGNFRRPSMIWPSALLLIFTASTATGATLEQFLARIKSTHPTMKKEAVTPEVAMSSQRKLAGEADWILKIAPRAMHTETSIVQPGLPETSTIYGTETSLEKTIWSTGTKLRFTANTEYVDQTYGQQFLLPQNGPQQTMAQQPPRPSQPPAQNQALAPGGQYRTGVGISISQPLLQNRGGGQLKTEFNALGFGVKQSQAQAAENQKTFLLQMAERFVDWALAEEREKIATERLKAELEVKARISGPVAQMDHTRAEDAVLAAKAALALAASARKATRAELAMLAQSHAMNEESAQIDLYKKYPVPEAGQAEAAAVKNSKVMAALNASRSQLASAGEGLSDKARPRLDLNLGAGVKGEDKEYGKSLSMDRNEWNASLVFIYPLGARSAAEDVRKNELEITRLESEINAAKLELASQARMLVTQISQMDQAMDIGFERAAAARRRAAEEEREYFQGRGSLAMALLARDNEDGARTALAENAALRTKLKLRLDAVLDQL